MPASKQQPGVKSPSWIPSMRRHKELPIFAQDRSNKLLTNLKSFKGLTVKELRQFISDQEATPIGFVCLYDSRGKEIFKDVDLRSVRWGKMVRYSIKVDEDRMEEEGEAALAELSSTYNGTKGFQSGYYGISPMRKYRYKDGRFGVVLLFSTSTDLARIEPSVPSFMKHVPVFVDHYD